MNRRVCKETHLTFHPVSPQHVIACVVTTAAIAVCLCTKARVSAVEPIRFDRDVRPILSDKCFHCHGPDAENREADLRLDIEESAFALAIEPGHADASSLVERIVSDDPDAIMPPPESKKELTRREIAVLRQWIDEGAEWSKHWSFEPLSDSPCADPAKSASAMKSDEIDAFINARLEEQGIASTPQADKPTLLRRVTLDLTGLPPTLGEIDAFLADQSPGAYERVVDRLLSSPHFGERMAIPWLDAARYGDTSVYHADGPRDMWAWRDAVVEAYNANMPFDEFSIAQIAGDLVPDASLRDKILSGFNRNNGTTDEGGAIAEEYRVEYAVDRVKTTATTWLGLTMECAQCHDHKYDPISQREYYEFYAFFNVSSDGGMQTRSGNATPTVEIPNTANAQLLADARAELEQKRSDLQTRLEQASEPFESWLLGPGRAEPPTPEISPPTVQAELKHLAKKVLPHSGTDQVGQVHGPAKLVDAPLGKALQFRGKTWIDLGNVGDFDSDASFSLSGWIRPQGGVGAVIAKMDDGNAFRGYDLYAGAGPVSMHIINAWPGNAIKVTTKKKLEKNKWHHVLATYDGSSAAAGIKIYVDGVNWDWKIEQDGLSGTTRTEKTLLIGSRHPGSRFQGDIARVEVYDRRLSTEETRILAATNSVSLLKGKDPGDLTAAERAELKRHFVEKNDSQYKRIQETVTNLEQKVKELEKPLTSVMVMGDQMKPRDTFVLNRGAYDSPTEEKVSPGTPSALPPMSDSLPRNRLGMAKWLFSPENPLTARVTVNRYWQMLFGAGLVQTPGDFGAQGSYPSHPELLDRLATDFRASGWDIKGTLKKILLSKTYQRSSTGKSSYAADPENQWLSRGARFRLQGEFVRDLALSTSGLLSLQRGGPGVKPYQPAGLWAEVGLGGNPKFKQDHGQRLYRRSLYTYWKRSAPPPSMQIFDAPTREKCTLQRPRTNTPLQAFVTLNDPQFVEASRFLAQHVLLSKCDSDGQRIDLAYRLVTARHASTSTLAALSRLLCETRQTYASTPELAEQLLGVGESQSESSLESVELAAFTAVCNVVLNLDESITRE